MALVNFISDKFNFEMGNGVSNKNEEHQKARLQRMPQPGFYTYQMYTCKYLSIKGNVFALKIVKVGSFISYAVIRESWLGKAFLNP